MPEPFGPRDTEAPPSLSELAGAWDIHEYFVTPGTTGLFAFVPADPMRWSLTLVPTSNNNYWVPSNPPALAGNWGIREPSSLNPVILTYRDHGALVQLAWKLFVASLPPSTIYYAIGVDWRL